MKLTSLVPIFLAATSAFATSLTHNYDVVQARQVKVHRDLLDICAALDVDLKLDSILRGGLPIVVGHLDVCLCVSVIPTFIQANIVAQAAVLLVGENEVVALLQALINDQQNKKQCTFPEHAHSICSAGNPCDFDCDDGYSPYTPPGASQPTSCVCAPPYTECNGKCGSFPQGCGSATPQRKRARRSPAMCAADKQVCGVPGDASRNQWDCVDVTEDEESCGGCIVPSYFAPNAPIGVDCRTIGHVDTVDCRASTCYVKTCLHGYVPSAAHDACVLPA